MLEGVSIVAGVLIGVVGIYKELKFLSEKNIYFDYRIRDVCEYIKSLFFNGEDVYKNEEFLSEPIQANLDTQSLLKDFDFGEIRNLYEWLNK